ncbi:hypothetical protein [Nocardiopsis sp. CC223A]|uniref:DUF6924 domain-containing protein n=1 Tax=Nocardiopsis sp. CC223A TaxID=3044051 RepID=UPI00278C027C|nr:hypothetical protein [Nocardiopsis sp. CC223A]
MTRPSLRLPPADDGPRVSGTLLVRACRDAGTWADVLSRMGPLPGLGEPSVESPRRLLLVVDDPVWRDASPEQVREALGDGGTWVPDLVLVATGATEAEPGPRPLLAFRPSVGDLFAISPRQAALVHLVLHRPDLDMTLEDYEQHAPVDPEGAEEDEEYVVPVPVGAYLEELDPAPRYEPPARPLPLLTQANDGLFVRTDFTDDDAWSSLVETVRHPGPDGFGDVVDDFGLHIDFVADPAFDGASPEQLMAVVLPVPEDSEQMTAEVVLIADGVTLSDPDRPVLVVPLEDHPGCAFRVPAADVGIMVVNLAIANQDLEDFMDTRTRDLVMPW